VSGPNVTVTGSIADRLGAVSSEAVTGINVTAMSQSAVVASIQQVLSVLQRADQVNSTLLRDALLLAAGEPVAVSQSLISAQEGLRNIL
jgi:chorismate-pyruvate lyase